MSLSALCFQPSRHAGCCGRNQSPDACQKNTGDLQWKSDAVCNVRPCADEVKAAGARTMGINGKNNGYQWKNNANNNGNHHVRLWRQKTGNGAVRALLLDEPGLFVGFAGELGRNSQAQQLANKIEITSGRANATLNLMPCAARRRNANEIPSIPAIQACARL